MLTSFYNLFFIIKNQANICIFYFKLLEQIFLPRIVTHLNNNNLLSSFQSAYRRHHSTETALLKVSTDILEAADNKKISLLVLLDLSSAFDLIDHQILSKRLNESFGLNDLTLEWFRSFNVKCPKTALAPNVYSTGVPQGSVFGPLLFTLYTADLEKLAASCNLRIHQYADDTQLYGHCSIDASMDLQERMSKCIDEIAAWMKVNQMKLNSSKAEVIWFSTCRSTCKLPTQPVRVLKDHIIPSDLVKNFGVSFDKDLSMKTHINNLLQMSFASLRKIRTI